MSMSWIHCERLVQGVLFSHFVWPPQSSDLNPSENLWDVLKKTLRVVPTLRYWYKIFGGKLMFSHHRRLPQRICDFDEIFCINMLSGQRSKCSQLHSPHYCKEPISDWDITSCPRLYRSLDAKSPWHNLNSLATYIFFVHFKILAVLVLYDKHSLVLSLVD